jgi:iron(III) transport system substrate-binding protein
MQHPVSKLAAVSAATLATTLAAFVGASIGSAAPATRGAAAPPDPIKSIVAQVKSLKVKGGFPNNPRDTKLHQLALQEGGQVSVYTSLSSFITKPLQDSWKSTFPDITLNLYRAASEDVSARFLSESAAGTKGADVVETNGTTMLIFQHRKNLLVPYRGSPYAAQIPKKYQFDDFTADRIEKFVIAWNTNLVKDPPKSFEDLADPKWKGKLAMEPTDSDWFAALYNYFTTAAKPKLTTAQADALFQKIAANSQLIPGHSAEASALAAGQVQVVVTGHAQSMEQLQAKNAPISFNPFVLPVVERPQGVGIPYLTPHPAAALLFYDYLLSPVGQKMLQQNGVEPANPYFPDSAFASDPFTVQVDIRPIVDDWVSWNKHYNSIIQP